MAGRELRPASNAHFLTRSQASGARSLRHSERCVRGRAIADLRRTIAAFDRLRSIPAFRVRLNGLAFTSSRTCLQARRQARQDREIVPRGTRCSATRPPKKARETEGAHRSPPFRICFAAGLESRISFVVNDEHVASARGRHSIFTHADRQHVPDKLICKSQRACTMVLGRTPCEELRQGLLIENASLRKTAPALSVALYAEAAVAVVLGKAGLFGPQATELCLGELDLDRCLLWPTKEYVH
jgi:hypothetical protein